tara:strand:+ start:3182 stop:4759 length:1578 start_codon:yes stop_codon:yes gene_type:complete
MSSTNYQLYVDWNSDGDYADSNENISNYVQQLNWDRGRDFANNLTGDSISGTLKAILINTSGIFSPFKSDGALFGSLVPGKTVSLQMGGGSFPYTFPFLFNQTVWTGYVKSIVPFPSLQGNDIAVLEAIGSLGFLNQKTIKVAPQTDRNTGTAIGDILDASGWGASARDLDTGNTTIKRLTIPANTKTIDALRMVENSENGFVSETKDGKIKFEKRQARLVDSTATTSQATLSDASSVSNFSFSRIEQQDSIRNIFNEITVNIKNYQTESGADVVWIHAETGSDSPAIPSGQKRIYRAFFPQLNSDTMQSIYTSADSINAWTTTGATTDVLANTSADGSGSNATSDLTIANVKTANYMDISLTNGNASTVYITKLQARATVTSSLDDTQITASDSTSETAFGKRVHDSTAPFVPNSEEGFQWCQYNLVRFKDPLQMLSVTIPANRNDTTLTNVMSLDISNRITLDAHTKTGLMSADKDFFIEAESHFVNNNKIHTVVYDLSPVSSIGKFWVMGVSLLEDETYIGY